MKKSKRYIEHSEKHLINMEVPEGAQMGRMNEKTKQWIQEVSWTQNRNVTNNIKAHHTKADQN